MFDDRSLVILIAPNVSEQMGGEALKALQIFREIKKQHPNTIQVTHGRCRSELSDRLGLMDICYIDDNRFSLALWRNRFSLLGYEFWFAIRALRLANAIARERRLIGNQVIIHQTEPNSPVTPRFVLAYHLNVFGPINGNIYYPPIFRHRESSGAWLRRSFHIPAQWVNRLLFHGKSRANAVLYAGGYRTRTSLLAAGYPIEVMFPSLDCGVDDSLLDRAREPHAGANYKFIHYGRLVFHKGTELAIEALTQTKKPICLDVIGRGPQLDYCKQLTIARGLKERVKFLDWRPSLDFHGRDLT